MSSTNRTKADGKKTVRRKDDFYETPAWVTEAIVPIVERGVNPVDKGVIDPFAGDGAILRMFETYGFKCHGVDKSKRRVNKCASLGFKTVQRDSLKHITFNGTHAIVTNPPFALAEEWLEKVMKHRDGDAEAPLLCVLLRLSFLESKSRQAFHVKYPAHVYVLSERLSFTDDGKTDSCAYGWFVWGDGSPGRWSILDAVKPKTERPKKKKDHEFSSEKVGPKARKPKQP